MYICASIIVLRADVESVLRTEKSEDGGQKEDGVQHPEDDDEKHDLEEGKEDIGLSLIHI